MNIIKSLDLIIYRGWQNEKKTVSLKYNQPNPDPRKLYKPNDLVPLINGSKSKEVMT